MQQGENLLTCTLDHAHFLPWTHHQCHSCHTVWDRCDLSWVVLVAWDFPKRRRTGSEVLKNTLRSSLIYTADHISGKCNCIKTMLSKTAWAAITECHRPRGLNKRYLFLLVLEIGSPRSMCQPTWFLVRVSLSSSKGSNPTMKLHSICLGVFSSFPSRQHWLNSPWVRLGIFGDCYTRRHHCSPTIHQDLGSSPGS